MPADDSHPAERRVTARLALGLGVVAQAIWSAVAWSVVRDSSRLDYFYNDDFYEWLIASGVGVAVLAALGALGLRRWSGVAFAAGCVLGLAGGVALFFFSAVSNSN